MRAIVKWAVIPAMLAAVACRDKADTDLAKDLAMITGSDIELANAGAQGAVVVSAVENIHAPSPKPTPTPTKRRGTKAPPPEATVVDAAPDEGTATAPQMMTVSPSDTPEAAEPDVPAPEAPPVIRPHPIEPRYPVGDGSIFGTGSEERGRSRGGTVVIRGGSDGRDPCEIHDRRRRPGRGPVVLMPGTYPGRIPGRLPIGTFPR